MQQFTQQKFLQIIFIILCSNAATIQKDWKTDFPFLEVTRTHTQSGKGIGHLGHPEQHVGTLWGGEVHAMQSGQQLLEQHRVEQQVVLYKWTPATRRHNIKMTVHPP